MEHNSAHLEKVMQNKRRMWNLEKWAQWYVIFKRRGIIKYKWVTFRGNQKVYEKASNEKKKKTCQQYRSLKFKEIFAFK